MKTSTAGLTVLAALLGVLGCGGAMKTTLTGPPHPAHSANCDFPVMLTAPEAGYVEIAAIDLQMSSAPGANCTDLAQLKEKIQPEVCRVGGDAVVAIPNGYGVYMKASVLKAVAETATPPTPSSSIAPSAPAPSSPSSTGCQYDTQCKGDRICVQSSCVDPPSKGGSTRSPAGH
ncbi:MAG TPA: hypothetical protein VHE30_20155 [Polyangiaceae bacterium]|nr:hypothetical protein [Polyangiaceae bacterium]